MPISTVRTSHSSGLTAFAVEFKCDICGAEACLGFGGGIRAAMKSKDASKGGVWSCSKHADEIRARWERLSLASRPEGDTKPETVLLEQT